MPDQQAAAPGPVMYQQPVQGQGQIAPASGGQMPSGGVPDQHSVGSPPQG